LSRRYVVGEYLDFSNFVIHTRKAIYDTINQPCRFSHGDAMNSQDDLNELKLDFMPSFFGLVWVVILNQDLRKIRCALSILRRVVSVASVDVWVFSISSLSLWLCDAAFAVVVILKGDINNDVHLAILPVSMALLFSILTIWAISTNLRIRIEMVRFMLDRNICPNCGYNLFGLNKKDRERCPECGWSISKYSKLID